MLSPAFKEMGRKPCCERAGLKRGRWTEEEDAKLTKYIEENGQGSWRTLPKNAGLLRCGKSCKLRWINYLRPDLEKGKFSSEEEDLIIHLHASLGTRWSMIARQLSGRTDNGIKNYRNSHLSRKAHPNWRREISNRVQALAMNVAKLDLPPEQKHGRKRSSGKKNQNRVQKSTQLPVLSTDADGSTVIDAVSPSTTEFITMANEVASNPDGGNNRENMERRPETAMREKPVETEERPSGSESNILVTADATNCFGDEMTAETVDRLFDLAEQRDKCINGSGSGAVKREKVEVVISLKWRKNGIVPRSQEFAERKMRFYLGYGMVTTWKEPMMNLNSNPRNWTPCLLGFSPKSLSLSLPLSDVRICTRISSTAFPIFDVKSA